jgi:hypothetical protein
MTETVYASLDALSAAQEDLYDELERGFGTRRDLLLWMHKASVRTLGHVPDGWASRILTNRYETAALLDDVRRREALTERAPDDADARTQRMLLGDDELLDACRDGMKLLGEQAEEYLDDELDGTDVSLQRYLAMRPGVEDVVTRQRAALQRVLGRHDDVGPDGLETREDVRSWTRGVVRATKGVDGGISRRSSFDLWWRQLLTGPVDSPTLHIHLAEEVLSVMNRSIRQTATASREAVAEDREPHGHLET